MSYSVLFCFETVQKTSLGYAGGKPNPLNPPYQGDFPLNSPLIRGARGVKNDERWVSCTVSLRECLYFLPAPMAIQQKNADELMRPRVKFAICIF